MAIKVTTNSDYMTVAAPGATQAFTFECWTYFIALPASSGVFQTIWSIDDNASNFTQLYVLNSGGVQTYGYTPAGGFDLVYNTGITAGTWFRTVIIQKPGATGSAFYLGTGTAPLRKLTSAVNGQNNPDPSIYFFNEKAVDQNMNGYMAGIKIWERILTEDEIFAQGKQLAPLYRRGLRYYFPFMTLQGAQINRTGYGSNGTVTGTLGLDAVIPPVPEVLYSKAPLLERVRGPVGTTLDVFIYEGMSVVETF